MYGSVRPRGTLLLIPPHPFLREQGQGQEQEQALEHDGEGEGECERRGVLRLCNLANTIVPLRNSNSNSNSKNDQTLQSPQLVGITVVGTHVLILILILPRF
jgi:hypothetical protein